MDRNVTLAKLTLHKKCPYSGLFWSVFFRIWTEYGEIRSIFRYSVRMRENVDQKNSEYGHFSLSVRMYLMPMTIFRVLTRFLIKQVGNLVLKVCYILEFFSSNRFFSCFFLRRLKKTDKN